ncbi:DUF1848 family protein [Acidobacteriota bacterium]
MKKVISASRRTDLVAFFPDWLSSSLKGKKVRVYGPSGHVYSVNLDPDLVHTIVLWSKNFSPLIEDRFGLRSVLQNYVQLFLHFTISGLGGSRIEPGVPDPQSAIDQLDPLLEFVKDPRRVNVRFDPVLHWSEGSEERSNLDFFKVIAPELKKRGISDVRFSFAQWYNKGKKRAQKTDFMYLDLSEARKKEQVRDLVEVGKEWGLRLYSCSQAFLEDIEGVTPSACIDGRFLQELHPTGESVKNRKDRTQRRDCRCTDSVDIGSYTQSCPHSCIYCYANPK